jgi:succinylglutamate desuccinylase
MKEFEQSCQLFSETGNFLDFTRQWENGFPLPDDNHSQKFVLDNGTKIRLYDTGILQFEPQEKSQTRLLISSGIHGNETAPMEIVDQMVKDIWSGKLIVKVNLMLIIGNPPAVNISKRFLSQNLNRLFSGKYNHCEHSDYETGRAKVIEQAVTHFYKNNDEPDSTSNTRYHFDLHTAIRPSQYEKFVLYPFMNERPWDKEHIEFFGGADITTVLLGNQPAGTFSYFTSNQFKALSATVELGKVKPFGENDMQSFTGITKNLERLIKDEAVNKIDFDNHVYTVFKVKQEIIKANEEYNLHLSDDVKNFTSFEKGTLLASDGKNEKYIVENDGEAIVFPNNKVPVGQRVGVLLERVKL